VLTRRDLDDQVGRQSEETASCSWGDPSKTICTNEREVRRQHGVRLCWIAHDKSCLGHGDAPFVVSIAVRAQREIQCAADVAVLEAPRRHAHQPSLDELVSPLVTGKRMQVFSRLQDGLRPWSECIKRHLS
jgi:hypothetical protein